jgi:hypothetical protein
MANGESRTKDRLMLNRGLDILDRMVKRMEDGERIEIADAVMILKFIGSLAGQGLSEQGLALVTGLERTLRTKKGKDFVRDSRRLSLLLRTRPHEQEPRLPQETTIALATPEIDLNLSRLGQKYAARSNSADKRY